MSMTRRSFLKILAKSAGVVLVITQSPTLVSSVLAQQGKPTPEPIYNPRLIHIPGKTQPFYFSFVQTPWHEDDYVREIFSADNLKEMNAPDRLEKLYEAGVCNLKPIEHSPDAAKWWKNYEIP